MTAAPSAGTAARIARSRRRVVDSFRQLGAVSAESAIQFHPLKAIDARTFGRLLKAQIVLPADGRRFYIDADALAQSDVVRGRIRIAALAGMGLVAAAAAAAAVFG